MRFAPQTSGAEDASPGAVAEHGLGPGTVISIPAGQSGATGALTAASDAADAEHPSASSDASPSACARAKYRGTTDGSATAPGTGTDWKRRSGIALSMSQASPAAASSTCSPADAKFDTPAAPHWTVPGSSVSDVAPTLTRAPARTNTVVSTKGVALAAAGRSRLLTAGSTIWIVRVVAAGDCVS